ncbi:hypothetical protein ANAPC1_00134 [Anaplasma phagocytophilum]|uniref:Uncharacterized protein n=1 Tax=Anaplasma phagocytophilum TaxID=948 RepID=A0AA45ZH08_ANAPH|nr:hypothetical protein [Anaplasma phagocytophilum]SBO13796.1 hypothetical protein ANAPC1_00134 [Anaplasma phagocytophilum]
MPNKAFIFVSNIELILQCAALGKGIYFDIIDSFSLRARPFFASSTVHMIYVDRVFESFYNLHNGLMSILCKKMNCNVMLSKKGEALAADSG